MSLTQDIANVVQAANNLTQEVAGKMGQIDNKVDESIKEMRNFIDAANIIDREYRINTATPAKILNASGYPLPYGAYIFMAKVVGTATGNTTVIYAVDVWTSPSSGKNVALTEIKGPGGTTSNHIEVFVDADNDLAIRLFNHTQLYGVETKTIGA